MTKRLHLELLARTYRRSRKAWRPDPTLAGGSNTNTRMEEVGQLLRTASCSLARKPGRQRSRHMEPSHHVATTEQTGTETVITRTEAYSTLPTSYVRSDTWSMYNLPS